MNAGAPTAYPPVIIFPSAFLRKTPLMYVCFYFKPKLELQYGERAPRHAGFDRWTRLALDIGFRSESVDH
jgi:hypothetical protein